MIKIGIYNNIFDVDKIEAGMEANIYVAFDYEKSTTHYMVFDDGYISNSVRGFVYTIGK